LPPETDMLIVGINVRSVPQADIVGDLTNAAALDDPKTERSLFR